MSLLDATTVLTEWPLGTGSQDSRTEEAAIELRTLASYVPPPYVRLLTGGTPPIPPSVLHFSGAVLFADISGFTKLTERLSQEGDVGAELLASTLTAYFGQVIDHISQYGGEVVKFAGDGLTALWVERQQQEAAAMAAECALSLQRRLSEVQAVHGVRMVMRIGVGLGATTLRQLGGHLGRWEFVFSGPALTQASLTCPQAAPSEVVLSKEVVTQLGPCALGEALNDGGGLRLRALAAPPPMVPSSSPILGGELRPALRACLPKAVLDRSDAGQSGWLTELRRVTVLFVHLPDLDRPGTNHAQELVTAIQEILAAYEGSINTLHVDEKGAMLLAVFGLPPLSHVDDALRGIRAALACQVVFQKRGTRCAIGITTGQAFCGTVGNDTRREYTVLGDVVNLAARLMSATASSAGGLPLLCDTPTYEATKTSITFGTGIPLTVKGKVQPILAYPPLRDTRLLENAAELPYRSRMLGRTIEVACINTCLQRLTATPRVGGLLLIEGAAGMGKSRLTAEMLEQTQALRIKVLIGHGDAIERTTAHSAFTPLFRSLFALPSDGSGGDVDLVREQLAQLVPDLLGASSPSDSLDATTEARTELERRLQLLSPVLRMELTRTHAAITEGWTAAMAGRADAELRQSLLIRILQCVSDCGPTLMLINDAHWLDSASWSLLLRARRDIPGLLIVLTSRPLADFSDPVARTEYQRLQQSPDAEILALLPLSQQETNAQLAEKLGTTAIPSTLLEFIFEQTAGHPFFSEELAFALVDAGVVRVEDGVCQLLLTPAELRDKRFPTTMSGVVQSRIDRLRAPQNLLLKIASVVGRTFSHQIVDSVHPIAADRPQLRSYLNELEQSELTSLLSDAELTYCFRHILIQEVAYSTLSFAQRRQLHLAVVAFYERSDLSRERSESAHRLDDVYPLLAYHYSQAAEHPHASPEELRNAVVSLQRAADQALRSGAAREAMGLIERALGFLMRLAESTSRDEHELALRVPQTIALGIVRGYAAAETEQALLRCQMQCQRRQAMTLGLRVPDLLPTLFGLWCCNLLRGRLWRARDFATQISEIASADHNPDTALAADLTQQVTCVFLGEFASARLLGESVQKRYRRDRHQHLTYLYGVDLEVMSLVNYGHALWVGGYDTLARTTYEQAIFLAREIGHPYSLGFALYGATTYYQSHHDSVAVSRLAEDLYTIAMQHGYGHTMLQSDFMRGWVMAGSGQATDGIALMERTIAARRRTGALLSMPLLLKCLAERQMEHGKLDEALALIHEAVAMISENGERFGAAEVLRIYAEIRRKQSRGSFIEFPLDDGPDDHLLRAIDIARCQQADAWEVRAVLSLCRLWQTQGNREEARSLLAQTLQRHRSDLHSRDHQAAHTLLKELSR